MRLRRADFDTDSNMDGYDFLTWQRGFGIASGATLTAGDANNETMGPSTRSRP